MAASSDRTGKLRLVLDYLPCEACLHMGTPEQELFCSLCTRLQRTVVQKSTVMRDVVVEKPVPVEPEVVEVPPAPVAVPLAAEPVEEEPEDDGGIVTLRANAPDHLVGERAQVIAADDAPEGGDLGVVIGGLDDPFPGDEVEAPALAVAEPMEPEEDWDAVAEAEGMDPGYFVAGEFDEDFGFDVANVAAPVAKVAKESRSTEPEDRVKAVDADDETSFVITPYLDDDESTAEIAPADVDWPSDGADADHQVISAAPVSEGSSPTQDTEEVPWPEDPEPAEVAAPLVAEEEEEYEVLEVLEEMVDDDPVADAPAAAMDAPFADDDSTASAESGTGDPFARPKADTAATVEWDDDEPAYEAPVVEDRSADGPADSDALAAEPMDDETPFSPDASPSKEPAMDWGDDDATAEAGDSPAAAPEAEIVALDPAADEAVIAEESGDEDAPWPEHDSDEAPTREAGDSADASAPAEVAWPDEDDAPDAPAERQDDAKAPATPVTEPAWPEDEVVRESPAPVEDVAEPEPSLDAAPKGGLMDRLRRRREAIEADLAEDEAEAPVATPEIEGSGDAAVTVEDEEPAEPVRLGDASSVPITSLDGVGPMYATRLSAADVESTDDLTGQDAWDLASRTGIAAKLLERWIAIADLIEGGVPHRAAEAFVKAGIKSPKDLKGRDAVDLARRVSEYDDGITEAVIRDVQAKI